jgi:hypothetical protein
MVMNLRDRQPTPDELRYLAGVSVQKWAHGLARRLSVDDAWRLLLGGAIAVMQAEHSREEMAALLRQAAELVERESDRGH